MSKNEPQTYLFKMLKNQEIHSKRFLVSFLLFFGQFFNSPLRLLKFNHSPKLSIYLSIVFCLPK